MDVPAGYSRERGVLNLRYERGMQGDQTGAGLLDPLTEGFCETLLKAQSDVDEGLLVVENRRILYANDAFCRISGYSQAELAGLPTFLELTAPDQRRPIEDWIHRHLCGEAGEDCFETAILHKSRRRVVLEVAVRLLERSNQPPQLVVLTRDIGDRKRLEERLKNSLGMLLAIH